MHHVMFFVMLLRPNAIPNDGYGKIKANALRELDTKARKGMPATTPGPSLDGEENISSKKK